MTFIKKMMILIGLFSFATIWVLRRDLPNGLAREQGQCVPLAAPPRAIVQCSGAKPLDTCDLSCEVGYVATGQNRRTCGMDHFWTGNANFACTAQGNTAELSVGRNEVGVVFVRHCEAEHNAHSAFQGRDPSLTAVGLENAAKLGQELSKSSTVDAILSSPLRRALQTASPFARAENLTVLVHPDLQELQRKGTSLVDRGSPLAVLRTEFTGHFNFSFVEEQEPEWENTPLPSTPRGVLAKAKEHWRRLGAWLREHVAGKTVLVVAHGEMLHLVTSQKFHLCQARAYVLTENGLHPT